MFNELKMNTENHTSSVTTDLLASILGVEIRNEEKISQEDRSYCQARQEKLYDTLFQLRWWYGLFRANAERYAESHKLSYDTNGSVKKTNPYRPYSYDRTDYGDFEFTPFDSIDKVVEKYGAAINAFASDIVRYFNEKYNVSVPVVDIDQKKLTMTFEPVYQSYVDHVIGFLGGKGFREVAEEEVVERFLKVVKPGNWSKVKPELKGDRIVFPDTVRYSDYSWESNNKINYNNLASFNSFCTGIYFALFGQLNGSYDQIIDFDPDNIDFANSYKMTINDAVTIKLFKNGRIDVKFKEQQFAERAFQTLRLDTLEILNDN